MLEILLKFGTLQYPGISKGGTLKSPQSSHHLDHSSKDSVRTKRKAKVNKNTQKQHQYRLLSQREQESLESNDENSQSGAAEFCLIRTVMAA